MWTCIRCLIWSSRWLICSWTLRWRWSLILVRCCLWRHWLIWRNCVVISGRWLLLLLNDIIILRVARTHIESSLEISLFLLLRYIIVMVSCVLCLHKIKGKSTHCPKGVVCCCDICSKQRSRCFIDLILCGHLILWVW